MDDRSTGQGSAMPVLRRATTQLADPVAAARDLAAQLGSDRLAGVFVFASPEYCTEPFARTLHRALPDAEIIGCSTAGEIGPGGYLDNSVVAIGLAGPDFAVSTALLPPLDAFSMAAGRDVARQLGERLDLVQCQPGGPGRTAERFAVLMIDSMAQREEVVTTCLDRALGGLPLFGASAGDGLRFERSRVYHQGAFHEASAVVALVATSRPFKVFRSQHFVAGEEKLVVTSAAPAERLVREINAEPAVEEYARLVGRPVDGLTPMVFATNPLVVRLGGAEYVRSIQKANPDGSLAFYAAIDEVLVLTRAEGRDMQLRLEELFAEIDQAIGEPELVLAFDCVLRRLELEHRQAKQAVSERLDRAGVVGFSTYGEQSGSMHLNQTFTGVAIGRRRSLADQGP